MNPIKPIASFVFIGFAFILFIVTVFLYYSYPEAEAQLGALIYPNNLILDESWRFISSCFLPLDWAEFFNIVFFFMFIVFFEGVVGWRRFIPIYLLSGVGTALIVFSLLPAVAPFAPPFALPGLSTCCMGALGATLGLVFQTWTDDKTKALKWLSKGALVLYSFQLFDDYLTQPDLLLSHTIAPVLGLALFMAQDLFSRQGRKHWRAKIGFLVGFSLISALLFIAGFGKTREYWDSPKAMISGAKICEALKNEACTAHYYLESAKKEILRLNVKSDYVIVWESV